MTDIEINATAKKKSEKISDSSLAGNYLQRIVASCKALAHSGAISMYNIRLMFAMCDRHGIPDVFFTLTPDDEHSFRVRLYANANMSYKLPELGCTDEICITDFKLQKKARLEFPGACSLEYQNIVQILIHKLFGWDIKKQRSTGSGVFGELIAWAVAHVS